MAENIQQFIETTASFLGKTADYFKDGQSPDVLLQAINHAKLFVQRSHDFELLKKGVSVAVFPAPQGGLLDNATEIGTGESVKVSKILDASIVNDVNEIVPINMISKQGLTNDIRIMLNKGFRAFNQRATDLVDSTITQDPYLYRFGNRVFFSPAFTVEKEVYLSVTEWMKPYGLEEDDDHVFTDWLLQYGSDFLLYRAMAELNVFLKEDQRLAISQKKMEEAWVNLTAWDATLIRGDENLD